MRRWLRTRPCSVYRPGAARRRRIDVARGVDRPDLEGVGAFAQIRVVLGRRAAREGSPIEAALEGGASLRGGEAEASRMLPFSTSLSFLGGGAPSSCRRHIIWAVESICSCCWCSDGGAFPCRAHPSAKIIRTTTIKAMMPRRAMLRTSYAIRSYLVVADATFDGAELVPDESTANTL